MKSTRLLPFLALWGLPVFAAAGLVHATHAALEDSDGSPASGAPLQLAAQAEPVPQAAADDADAPRIQLAILLDTSGSMSGLIDQARARLWRVVGELGRVRRDGRRPRLELAVYEYGNSRLSAQDGWIRRVVPFTSDLDRVSEALFALTTSGGDEYCGQVIQTATRELDWSDAPGDLRLLFIAGNEPFEQGPVDWRGAVREAAGRGIQVTTVHCGDAETGIAGHWQAAALLAEGRYHVIDHDRMPVHVDAPQDAEIARLGEALNATYLPYGREGAAGLARQAAQDSNARRYGGSASSRALFKASRSYSNSGWDLVDAVKERRVRLEALPAEALPERLRGLSEDEVAAEVARLAQARARIAGRIAALKAEREAFLADARTQADDGGPDALDDAVLAALREGAGEKGWTFR